MSFRRIVPAAVLFIAVGWVAAQDAPPGVVATVKGHDETIYSLAISPDGKLLATGSFDKTVRFWELPSGSPLRTLGGPTGHQNLVLSLAFSPDGLSLASGGSDNTAKVWDVPRRDPLLSFAAPESVEAVALSPDGKQLAAGGKDGAIKLINPSDGKVLFNLTGHAGAVIGVAFSANGQLLASSGADNTLRFWNPIMGQPIASIPAHASAVTSVGIHANGQQAYTVGEDGLLKFWALPPVAPRPLPPHADAITALTLSANGAQVITGGADKVVRVSQFANGQQQFQLPGPTTAIASVTAAPNNTLFAAGTADGRAWVWQANDGKLIASPLAHTGSVTGIGINAQVNQLITTGDDGMVKVWALPLAANRTVATPDAVSAAILTADGKRLFTAGADKQVRQWNATNAQPERQYAGHTAPITRLAVAPNGTVVASAGEDGVRVWDVNAGKELGRLGGHVGTVNALSLHPNSTQLLSAGADGAVKLWQLPLTPPKPLAHPDAVTAAVLTPDGARLLTGGADKQARLWNLANGQPERAYPAGTLGVAAVAVGADNATIAVAGLDKTLVIGPLNGSQPLAPLAAPLPTPAVALAFSPDTKTLAAGLADGSVKLIDVASLKETKTAPAHPGGVAGLAFTANGALLVSAGADNAVKLWKPADLAAAGKYDLPSPATALTLNKDGSRVAAAAGKVIGVWTLADNKPTATITAAADVKGLGFHPDGMRLAAACADNQLRVYSAEGQLQEAFAHDGPLTAAAFLPTGKQIVSASADKTARVWTSALLWQAAHAGPVRSAMFGPRGDIVLSVGDDQALKQFAAADGKEQRSTPAHAPAAIEVAATADGTKAITLGADNKLKVWTLADGKAVLEIPLPAPPTRLAVAPNGLRAAVGLTDPKGPRTAVFDLVSGRELQSLTEPAASGSGLAFAADNRTLLAASADKVVHLLDAAATAAWPAHAGGATGLAVLPNGTQIVTGGKDKTAKQWDLTTSKELRAFGPITDPVSAVTVSRDGAAVAASAGKTARVWQVADGKDLATLTHPAEVVAVTFNADRTRLATGATDNLARAWDLATQKELQGFSHGAAVRGVAWQANPPLLVTASADKTALIHTPAILRTVVASAGPVRAMTVVPNNVHVLTGGDDKEVKLWNVGNGNVERSFPGATGPVRAVAVSKNSQLVAAAGADKKVRIFTFNDGKDVAAIDAPGEVRGLTFHPTAPILAAACADKSVIAWNIAFTPGQPLPAEFGRSVQVFTHAAEALAVTFNPDGTILASGGADKTAKLWKLASESPTRNFAHPNLVDAVAFAPNGTLLATGCHDGVLRIWDLAKNAIAKEVKAHVTPQASPIYAVAWTANSAQVATASLDQTVKLWDVASGNMVRDFKAYADKTFEKGHRDGVFCLAFGPGDTTLVTGSSDRTIKLWTVADGNVAREFVNPGLKPATPSQPAQAHPGWIYGVRFTPDGKHLVSAGAAPKNRGYLAVWSVADGKMVAGLDLATGPVYGLALTPDGKTAALGCGPRSRQESAAEAVLLKVPGVP